MADTFQLLIDDTSPVLSFFPFPDTLAAPDLLAGWNPYFTETGFANPLGEVGEGTSLHITSLDQAAFSIQWFGTAIQLFGNITAATYDLVLDGQTNSSISSFSDDPTLLASYEQLAQRNHTLSLIFHNPTNSTSSLIAIDNAVITVSTESSNRSISCTVATNIVEDTNLAFVGQWSFQEVPSVSPEDTTFHTSSNAGDWVSYNFTGSAVSVNGLRDITAGHYSVQLDNDTVILSGQSSFKEPAALFFQGGLDRSIPHTLTITNREDRQLTIGALNITSLSGPYDEPGSSKTSGMPRGTIAAIAVAASLGFLVLCILLFCTWRRRRRMNILHRRRMFASTSGSDLSGVLDIAPGTEDPEGKTLDKSKSIARDPSGGSLSFTLELPVQDHTSLRGSVQELPRSPTVSLAGRTHNNHVRETSRGALMQDISTSDGVYVGVREQSPFHVDFAARVRQNSEGRPHPFAHQNTPSEARASNTENSLPVLSLPLPPRFNVISSTPVATEAPHRQPSYSFLDISTSSRESSLGDGRRVPSIATSSSSSMGARIRRFSEMSFAPTRPISLPFALQYHRNSSLGIPSRRHSPERDSPPRSARHLSLHSPTSPIRPLPRIPHSPPASPGPSPDAPTNPLLPMELPELRVQTQYRSQPIPNPPSAGPSQPSAFASNTMHLHPHRSSRPPAASPTESVPVTVSDIHFRHSSDEEEEGAPGSRRSSAGLHRPPHPPLPQPSYASPFIMQKLLGGYAVLPFPGSNSANASSNAASHGHQTPPDEPKYAPGLGRPTTP
ncbi:hypothetical protein FA95DRAFT_1098201 [Auriscalpium vulgare]|uniref:Uncharacterized protein n=1 Tax=Auriscalpium vulgare TaxID=40419 RepID=A0ACB8RWD5_9AGAM|nr:hypothetical protein FA95DRAFT_1098201 [Auriscalpium vulgare]